MRDTLWTCSRRHLHSSSLKVAARGDEAKLRSAMQPRPSTRSPGRTWIRWQNDTDRSHLQPTEPIQPGARVPIFLLLCICLLITQDLLETF